MASLGISKLANKQVLAGIGATAGLLITAYSGYSVYSTGSCKSPLRLAYQKFMPMMDCPDLSEHNNCMANHLTPKLYAKLRDRVRYFVLCLPSIINILAVMVAVVANDI